MAQKRTSLSVEKKIEIMEKLQEGVSTSTLAEQYHVCLETVRRIQREENRLRLYATKGYYELRRKKIRGSKYEDLENRLYTWFLERRTMGDLLTDLLLRQKALEIAKEMGIPSSFHASRGWLTRFKNRHNIRSFHLHEEQASAATEAADKFVKDFLAKIENEFIKLENIYNMGETGLMWKAIPSKTLELANMTYLKEKKMEKDRVTVGLCTNVNGTHKLPPILIHKYKIGLNTLKYPESLPVIYKNQKQAWLNRKILINWYKNDFKPSVRKYQLENGISGKVILLLNNYQSCALQESEDDDNFEIHYLPPNTTVLLQPMDQGIIANMKQTYRHKMLQKIIQYEGGLEEFFKEFNIRDCIKILDEVWRSITQSIIQNAWKKIFIQSNSEEIFQTLDTDVNCALETINGHTIGPEDAIQCMTECEEAENLLIEKGSASEDEVVQDEEKIQRDKLEENIQTEGETEEEKKNKDLDLAYRLIKKHVYTQSMLPVVQAVVEMVRKDKELISNT